MRDRMYKVDRISKRNFDRAIEDKIRPAKIDMLKEMKLPDIRNTKELFKNYGHTYKGYCQAKWL